MMVAMTTYHSDWLNRQCKTLCIYYPCRTLRIEDWWRMTGSNRRPPACKAGALPAELIPQSHTDIAIRIDAPGVSVISAATAETVVGLDGFEPSTPALSRRCSNQLSYRPLSLSCSQPISVSAQRIDTLARERR
jgi:hypothetical protein